MMTLLSFLDSVCYVILFIFIIYLLLFSLFSLKKRNISYPRAKIDHRFVVLFPAYKEDAVIVNNVRDFFKQDYPNDKYDVFVISDQMKDSTINELKESGAKVLTVNFENSTKAAAINFAIDHIGFDIYDIVVIMDADNRVEPTFLQSLNNVYGFGIKAMQARRVAKNRNSDIALLDAASEAINNSIFRQGHVNAGLSSALSGSGMAFDFKWFRQNIKNVHTAGEDKEIELLLLYDNIYIDYLDNVLVRDEKTQEATAFSRQRRRWLFAQYETLKIGLKRLPQALINGNIDYCDKLFQWIMLPRVIILGIVPPIILLCLFIEWQAAIKWIGLYVMFLVSLSIALPDELYDKHLKKAIRKLPLLFVKMLLNFFKRKRKDEGFIHTLHGEEE